MRTVGDWLARHPDLDRRDREVLLCRAAGLSRAQLLTRRERTLEPSAVAILEDWAARRRGGEPLAYILGEREFWGIELAVSPAVLVPRPETELLVELTIELLERARASAPSPGNRAEATGILELGTGSGAVAIALALETAARGLPATVTATDVSAAALELARANGRRHGVEITWLESDWFRAVAGYYEVIVANPPYVAAGDPHLDSLGHEPRTALLGGGDGLDAIRALLAGAPDHLRTGGHLLLEHGHDQSAAVRELLAKAGFVEITSLRDLAGLERVTRGVRGGCP